MASRRRRPLTPGKIENYKFGLPNVNHVFAPGHRIMVQVQSSLFPLYDRNPQTYVPIIFEAKAGGLQTGDTERGIRAGAGECGVAAGGEGAIAAVAYGGWLADA